MGSEMCIRDRPNIEVSMIDGAKSEIEGVNHNIDGAKCHVLEYFVV